MKHSGLFKQKRYRKLTDARFRVLVSLADFIHQHGYGPSVRELAGRLQMSAHSSVHLQLEYLQQGGYISHQPGKARSWHLTDRGLDTLRERQLRLPLAS